MRTVVVTVADGVRTLDAAQWDVDPTGCLHVRDQRAVPVMSFAAGHWFAVEFVGEAG